ncbi:MAG: AMP-binding protein, partial [Lachnospiraceae bacterium]
MNFISSFQETVQQFPKKPALADRDGTRVLSYAELDSLSGRVAAKLLSLGLAEGSPVLIRMGRKAEYVAAYLGILKAALATVPSSPEYPEARLVAIRQDCGCALTIDEAFFEDLEDYAPAVREPSSEDVTALLLYTSGSTGKPKGIRHTVRSLCDGAVRGQEVYQVKGDLVFAASAPMSFIAFVFEYLGVFAVGGFVHILSDEVRKDIGRLEKYYAEKGITMGFLSPRVLRNFRYPGGPLERIFTASERLSGVYTDAYEIINGYGMSETAGVALTFRVDQVYDNTPIGKPVPGVGLCLLDEEGKEVPDGEEGEICLTGVFAN